MYDAEMLKYSENQKQIANNILADSGLIPLLSKYGKCSVIGGLNLNVMFGPDIDIVVETKNPRDASVRAIMELIEKRDFQKYQYGDFVKYPKKNRLKGFIVVLISEVDGVKWETEIWFVEKYPQDKIDRDLRFKESLTPENRLTILRLKQAREMQGDDKNRVSSTDIYRAVLEDGITDYLKLRELLISEAD
ncbi:TPA: hypothetical protein DIU27_02465 [Candidatus Collierbacteria bacterium]|uniref:Uncharacterized protein n=1 Tax=Candidatus Collierbacteria bacterium GW2011_GWB2_44_22 TaxID=1618387 RepID=A0A0G1KUC2_9BACT|nr:MAG: hypothetical protein UW31_C0008G0025 [Candidatus Collierbacteria bacterium GW2011_GWA2_44_13]KKT50994.1 MAG: hypothetical protein UW42_C0010G0008 [Candidatus Collierbacteria bacterium GW2011_GWB1_44_197]KKT51514.1 MAG: hypothetical protein UW44_C0011G0025 [Candidatus Collierbacteria bacterium GW2011_GWB2_44_22]KKT62251.1 MAG: hypothetical protein UW56_C0009G0025 [Candidatus Collierbacteria bacterium GW2011_GWD1_44_27]KKT66792.1 MAG: hypothetical protein UW58_C0003G0025 [Candidatus Colli